jgi:trans-aconitate methyltransferase
MEIIRGKHTAFINASMLASQMDGYDRVHLDLGTGDGRFVRHIAQTYPHRFVIGIDACRENLCEGSRRAPSNALFVVANAQTLPPALHGLATTVTINFPWGSLIHGLLDNDGVMLASLMSVIQRGAELEVRLNGGALSEAGWTFEDGARQVRHVLTLNGFDVCVPSVLRAQDLKAFPTTWAKRLAFGRDPRAVYLRAARRAR